MIIMNSSHSNSENFKFLLNTKSPGRLISLYIIFLLPLGFPPPQAATLEQNKGFSLFRTNPPLANLGNYLELNSQDTQEALKEHDEQLNKINIKNPLIIFSLIYSFIFYLIWFVILAIIVYLICGSIFFKMQNLVHEIECITIVFLGIISAPIFKKIIEKFLFNNLYDEFAEELAARELINLLIDLKQINKLNKSNKYKLKQRINFLVKLTRIIGIKISKVEPFYKKQRQDHYELLALKIQKKISDIFQNEEGTLDYVKRYFCSSEIKKIYISGYYGGFKWTENNAKIEESNNGLSSERTIDDCNFFNNALVGNVKPSIDIIGQIINIIGQIINILKTLKFF